MFAVDSNFYRHTKVLNVLANNQRATATTAFTIWTFIGTYLSNEPTNGRIDEATLTVMMRNALTQRQIKDAVAALVAEGLWEVAGQDARGRTIYAYHDWAQWNRTPDEIRASRKMASDRQKKSRQKKAEQALKNAGFSPDPVQICENNPSINQPSSPPVTRISISIEDLHTSMGGKKKEDTVPSYDQGDAMDLAPPEDDGWFDAIAPPASPASATASCFASSFEAATPTPSSPPQRLYTAPQPLPTVNATLATAMAVLAPMDIAPMAQEAMLNSDEVNDWMTTNVGAIPPKWWPALTANGPYPMSMLVRAHAAAKSFCEADGSRLNPGVILTKFLFPASREAKQCTQPSWQGSPSTCGTAIMPLSGTPYRKSFKELQVQAGMEGFMDMARRGLLPVGKV